MDAKRYNNIKLGIGISKAVVSFVLLFLFIWLGYSTLLETYVSSYAHNQYIIFLAFTFITGIAASILYFIALNI